MEDELKRMEAYHLRHRKERPLQKSGDPLVRYSGPGQDGQNCGEDSVDSVNKSMSLVCLTQMP